MSQAGGWQERETRLVGNAARRCGRRAVGEGGVEFALSVDEGPNGVGEGDGVGVRGVVGLRVEAVGGEP